MMSYDIFMNLEVADSQALLGRREYRTLWFHPVSSGPLRPNPDGLPVGVTKEVIAEGRGKRNTTFSSNAVLPVLIVKLSKSRFLAGSQCLKRLYWLVHEPELAAGTSAAADAILEQGRQVGLFARKMFPGGVETCSDDLDQAIRATPELTANPEVSGTFEGSVEHGRVLVFIQRS